MKTLRERLKEAAANFKRNCQHIRRQEEILDVLRMSPLWHQISDKKMDLSYWAWHCWLKIYTPVDIQDVEDNFCRLIHEKYGCDWNLEANEDHIELTAYPFGRWNLQFHIDIYETPSCAIRKIKVRTLTDKELEDKRHEYKYFIDCNGREAA